MNTHLLKRLVWMTGGLLLLLSSCKKFTENLPGNVQDNALNFYTVSDVLSVAYGSPSASSSVTAVFVDSLRPNAFDHFSASYAIFPVFNYNTYQTWGAQYPFPFGSYPFLIYAYYNQLPAGHRLFFTDTSAAVVLKDTTIQPAGSSYTCIYFADAPVTTQNQPVQFNVFAYNEDRSVVPSGKIGVRFINLSPDAGALTCNLLTGSGGTQDMLNSASLSYGQASDYRYLDSSVITDQGAVAFNLYNSTTGTGLKTGVLFSAGRRYVILVAGALNDRQVQFGTKTLKVSNNLRVIVRDSY